MELAERIGQSEIQVGAHGRHGALSVGARRRRARHSSCNERLAATGQPGQPDWFQGRELVEALSIHLALTQG